MPPAGLSDAEALLAIAGRAARAAGRYLAAEPRRDVVPVAETAHDIKLHADQASEQRIVDVLSTGPSIPIIAEERLAGSLSSDDVVRWIVDPLDGTMNYAQGIPFCCVSVALWRGDLPLLGVVYDFDRDEMFSAAMGLGAWLNGSTMHVRSKSPNRAVLCTGFPAGTDFAPAAVQRFVEQVGMFRKIRLLGSAALSLAYLAAGRVDAYFERDIRIWDVAAGLALVRAAGGEYICAPSTVPHALTVYAHNGMCPWAGPDLA